MNSRYIGIKSVQDVYQYLNETKRSLSVLFMISSYCDYADYTIIEIATEIASNSLQGILTLYRPKISTNAGSYVHESADGRYSFYR